MTPRSSHVGLTLVSLLVFSAFLLPVFGDDEEDVVKLSDALVQAMNDKDIDALALLIADGAVFAIDMDQGISVMNKEQLLFGPEGIKAGPPAPITVEPGEINIVGRMAFCQGSLSAEGAMDALPVCLIAAKVEEAWQVVCVALSESAAEGALPPGAEEIVDDILSVDATGMQATLAYLPDGPCLAVLALPEATLLIPGRPAIEEVVGQWEPPAEVTTEGEPAVLRGASLILVSFDSSLQTGGNQMGLHNALLLTRQGVDWKVALFAAAVTGLEPLEPQPAVEAEEGAEGEEGAAGEKPQKEEEEKEKER